MGVENRTCLQLHRLNAAFQLKIFLCRFSDALGTINGLITSCLVLGSPYALVYTPGKSIDPNG